MSGFRCETGVNESTGASTRCLLARLRPPRNTRSSCRPQLPSPTTPDEWLPQNPLALSLVIEDSLLFIPTLFNCQDPSSGESQPTIYRIRTGQVFAGPCLPHILSSFVSITIRFNPSEGVFGRAMRSVCFELVSTYKTIGQDRPRNTDNFEATLDQRKEVPRSIN